MTKQILYRDNRGRFISPKILCSRDCSIFYTCKQDKLAKLGKFCRSRARLPEVCRKEPVSSFKQYDLQERELRRCACEGAG